MPRSFTSVMSSQPLRFLITGSIAAWDPVRRRLKIDGRRLWVAPTVAVFVDLVILRRSDGERTAYRERPIPGGSLRGHHSFRVVRGIPVQHDGTTRAPMSPRRLAVSGGVVEAPSPGQRSCRGRIFCR
jgi:hypothetical protein